MSKTLDEIYDLEEKRLKEEIVKRGAKRVLLQLPEGLKPQGPRLAAVIEDAGAVAVISGGPCYGACDLPLCEAEHLEVDLVVHYGHTEMVSLRNVSVPVLYIEAKANIEVRTAVEKALKWMGDWKRIGLVTTVQHVHMLEEAKAVLEAADKTVYIGRAGSTEYPGQVLGCDYGNAVSVSNGVEAFLFVGGGRFHALGVYLATMKPTVVADPYENRAYVVDSDAQKIIRRRWANINEARKARNFGVIIGLKPGQSNVQLAYKIKKALNEKGKNAVLLALREISPSVLLQFPSIDAYVNTACPRIVLGESAAFVKPMLTVKEAEVVLGWKRWEDLLEDGFV